MKRLFFALMCVCVLVGCTVTKYVPEYHTEYVYKTDSVLKRDSIYIKDSVSVEKSGDTIKIEKKRYIYIDRWHDASSTDKSEKCDSVPYPVYIEKSLSWWQRQKIAFGEWFMMLALLIVVSLAVRIWLIKRKSL